MLSPGELFNVFFTVESHISHSFKRFQHLPKAFKLAQVEEFPRKFKEGDKTLQKVSFVAPSGQVPSEFQLIFEFIFEKEDTNFLITTVPLLIRILKPEEIPSDQLSIIADHKIDINGNLTTALQEFPKMKGQQTVLSEEIELVEIETKVVDTDGVDELSPPEIESFDTLFEEQVETSELLLEPEEQVETSELLLEPEEQVETSELLLEPEEQVETSELLLEPEDKPTNNILSEDKTEMLTDKISEYTRKIVSLEDQLKKQTRDLKLKEEDLKNREEEIMILKNENTRLDDAIGKYRANINDLERTLEEITPRLSELETKFSERGKKINQQEEINANLRRELDEKDKELKQQKDVIGTLSEYKSKTEKQIALLKTKTDELELLASEQAAKVIALEETRKELNDHLDEKTEEIMKIKNERDQLQVKQRELKRVITQLSQQIEDELKPHIEKLQEALVERESKINQLKRRLSSADNQLNEKVVIIEQLNKEIAILKEQFIIEPEEKIIEYYGPTEEKIITEEPYTTPIEPEVEDLIDEPESITLSENFLASPEEDGLIEESAVSETEEISREKEIEEFIVKGGEIDIEEIELPVIDETKEIYEQEIEEKEILIPDAPKCEICGSPSCPTCGSSLSFCKVRCTHCRSIMHRHCAEGMRPSENDVFINCPTCSEKVVL